MLLIFAIGLTSEKKSRSDRVHAVGRVPITPHAKIVAATLIVEIVVKTTELSVLKANARETSAAGNGRGHDFHNDADTPFFITEVGYLIAHAEKESLSFRHDLPSFANITRLMDEINAKSACDGKRCGYTFGVRGLLQYRIFH
jgi:hypothetical protein